MLLGYFLIKISVFIDCLWGTRVRDRFLSAKATFQIEISSYQYDHCVLWRHSYYSQRNNQRFRALVNFDTHTRNCAADLSEKVQNGSMRDASHHPILYNLAQSSQMLHQHSFCL